MTQEEIKTYVAEKMATQKAKKNKTKKCGYCGRETSELMGSARGSVCPDCYDICSD